MFRVMRFVKVIYILNRDILKLLWNEPESDVAHNLVGNYRTCPNAILFLGDKECFNVFFKKAYMRLPLRLLFFVVTIFHLHHCISIVYRFQKR